MRTEEEMFGFRFCVSIQLLREGMDEWYYLIGLLTILCSVKFIKTVVILSEKNGVISGIVLTELIYHTKSRSQAKKMIILVVFLKKDDPGC